MCWELESPPEAHWLRSLAHRSKEREREGGREGREREKPLEPESIGTGDPWTAAIFSALP